MKKEKYYLPFFVDADINYLYLFSLLDLAEYSSIDRAFNIINYKSQADICSYLGVSSATFQRMINNPEYKKYFSCDTKKKTIVINNSFSRSEGKPPFIVFSDREVSFLRDFKDALLCKYFAYIKYYCGYSSAKGTEQNFTIKQFLSAIGYCSNSKSYENKILKYNDLLVRFGFISIKKYRDELGHTRNIYTYNSSKFPQPQPIPQPKPQINFTPSIKYSSEFIF